MASRRAVRPNVSRSLALLPTGNEVVDRSLKQVEQAVQLLQESASRWYGTADLVVGTNKLRHGLGREVRGFTITLTTPDAAFSSAINTNNPMPDLEVWIDVIGAGTQTGARVEVW